MRSSGWLLGCLVIAVFIVITVITQLNTDASPAAAFCTAAERQGVPCKTGPRYDAQVVVLTDAAGTQNAYLVISQGSTTITAIPLQ